MVDKVDIIPKSSTKNPKDATPAACVAGGRQYLVIACVGGKLGSKSDDAYVAFALPAAGPDARRVP